MKKGFRSRDRWAKRQARSGEPHDLRAAQALIWERLSLVTVRGTSINEPPTGILPSPLRDRRRSYSTPRRSTFFRTTLASYPGENPGRHRCQATQSTPQYIPEPSAPALGIAGQSDDLDQSSPATEVDRPFRSLRQFLESDGRPYTRRARRVLESALHPSPAASCSGQSGEPPVGRATT